MKSGFALLLLPVVFVAWSAAHLEGFSWDYDEGIHVYIAWLVQQGHPLYTQTFSPYTPGFIVALVAAFDLFGATMPVARMLAVLSASVGMASVMGMAYLTQDRSADREERRRSEGLLAAVTVALLLALTPAFLQWSRAAMSDLPAASVMALAVACALFYTRTQRLRWLFASEIIAMCALWIKLIAVGGLAGIALSALLVLGGRRDQRVRVVWGTGIVLLIALIPLIFFDVRALFEQSIYFHLQKRAAYDQSFVGNLLILADFLRDNLALATFAVLGAVLGLRRGNTRTATWILLTWLIATFLSLAAQAPLFANHHPVVLVFALASLGGAGVGMGIGELRSAATLLARRSAVPAGRLSSWAFTALCLLIALLNLNGLDERLRAVLAPPYQPAAEEASVLLGALTSRSDLVVSDAQMIAFRAQREAPPALSDTSQARIASGNLSAEQLIALSQQSHANAILFWSGRIESLPPFVEWAQQNYYQVRSSLQKPNASYRLLMREAHPQHALDARFGDGIQLLGYEWNRRSSASAHAGQPLALTLYFRRVGAVNQSLTAFVHLLGADGNVAVQEDRLPLDGRYPTDRWQTGDLIADEFVLPLDADMSEGEYAPEIGFYLRETLQRVPVFVGNTRQPQDRLLLQPVHINAGGG